MRSMVIGNLSLAAHRLDQGETDVVRYIDYASDGAERAAALTRRLLAFARRRYLDSGADLIWKPFTADQPARKIRAAIDR